MRIQLGLLIALMLITSSCKDKEEERRRQRQETALIGLFDEAKGLHVEFQGKVLLGVSRWNVNEYRAIAEGVSLKSDRLKERIRSAVATTDITRHLKDSLTVLIGHNSDAAKYYVRKCQLRGMWYDLLTGRPQAIRTPAALDLDEKANREARLYIAKRDAFNDTRVRLDSLFASVTK